MDSSGTPGTRRAPAGLDRARLACSSAAAAALLFLAVPTLAADPPAGPAFGEPVQPSQTDSAARQQRLAQAIALYDEARGLYSRGEYRGALAKLDAAIKLDPDGKELLYNLAFIHERLAEFDIALGFYNRYLTVESDPATRERVVLTMMRLEGAKKEAERYAAASAASKKGSGGADADAAQNDGSSRSALVLITGGIALTSLAVGGIFGVSALFKHPGDHPTTGPATGVDQLREDARTAHTHAIIADVAIAVGVLLAGTSLYLQLTGGGSTPPAAATSSTTARADGPLAPIRAPIAPPAPARVDLVVGVGQGGLRVTF